MSEEKKGASYEDFRETASDFGEDRGHDFLTDPAAVASAKEKVEDEKAARHGERLRATRESRGFSLDELAARTGIDREALAQLEAGEAFLPLGQLIKLSKALSLKMADVISTGEEAFTIVRAHQRPSYARFGKAKQDSRGYEYQSLAPNKKDRLMEPFIVTLHPASTDELSSHDGQEFIYVLEGEMEVVVNDTRDVLKPGDAIYYDSTSMHLVKAHGDKPAKILAVLIS
ncbi:MAG TPA: XRE family transcriptional regulator [Desulfomonilaceae bacterium]|nr:XRE family transcriptional regulator [Desulfomonilaceae bacterium]